MARLAKSKLFSILLTLIITMTMSSAAFELAFAEEVVVDSEEQQLIDENEDGEVVDEEAIDNIEIIDEHSEDLVIDAPFEEVCRPLSDKILGLNSLGINLREMLGEGHNGYSVVQGSCTDGTYAYYLMVSSSTQKGRVLKVRMSDKTVVGRSAILNTCHGNGMTYDSKRNALAVIAREKRKQEITIIDAESLVITRQENVKYSNYADATESGTLRPVHQQAGLAAIAYCEKYDCYIALERSYHNLLVFNPDTFEAIGYIMTTITSKYPGTYQAMDADEQYVYLLLSKYTDEPSKQPNNVIVALDWNSESLQPILNGKLEFIEKGWNCGNGDGYPTAALTLNGGYEAESIYHTGKAVDGAEHFYLASYRSHTENRTVAYQVKWKKVWKKVKYKKAYKKKQWFNTKKQKWQNKKPKKKYRGPTRKIIKYKTKTKRKKVWKYKTKYRSESYLARDNYVYDLGLF